jgi:hypothetical protein
MKASSSSRTPVRRKQRFVPHSLYPSRHSASWALLCLCACNTGSISDEGEIDPGVFGGQVVYSPTRAPFTEDVTPAPTTPATPASCTTAQPRAAAPIARLTNTEYRNTLHSLLPELGLPELTLPADVVVEGFDNNAKAQTPSAALIEQYSAAAEAVSDVVVADLDHVLPCAADADEACASAFIDGFVGRAYRRPLHADERTRYLALFRAARAEDSFAQAIGVVVQAALQSPHFLYRVEPAVDGYALASRLSYFFWDDMPDEELLAAADSGALGEAGGIETQARRMLEDPRARPAVASLFRQWLRFDKMERMPKNAQLFPDWNEQVSASLRSGTARFVDHVFWDNDGSLDALLTDSSAYVDQNTAALYGLSAQLTDMTLMDTDRAQRSGILTQAGLLAAFAHETADSPVLRGVFVMDRLLCTAPPPPPPGVTGSIVDDPTTYGMPMTTRDRVALTHESGACAGCHHTIDGFGFGFSHYDAVGRWRDTENGVAVNSAGWIANTRDADGTFDGVVELGQKLAQSAQVSECASQQWFRYSLGLGAADVDRCALEPIAKAFADSDGSLKELMIAIATSPAFRTRGGEP